MKRDAKGGGDGAREAARGGQAQPGGGGVGAAETRLRGEVRGRARAAAGTRASAGGVRVAAARQGGARGAHRAHERRRVERRVCTRAPRWRTVSCFFLAHRRTRLFVSSAAFPQNGQMGPSADLEFDIRRFRIFRGALITRSPTSERASARVPRRSSPRTRGPRPPRRVLHEALRASKAPARAPGRPRAGVPPRLSFALPRPRE